MNNMTNPGLPEYSPYSEDREFYSDVLVVGGGLAGCFAAIKAREQGASVTLIDKGYVGKSGQTPFSASSVVFNPSWGDDLDACMNQIISVGEYINNRDWVEICLKESYARFQELVSWGVEFEKAENGELLRLGKGANACKTVRREIRKIGAVMREQALKSGVSIIDRVMATELLKKDGRIVGVVAVQVASCNIYVFNSKATILAAGAGGMRSPGMPISELTHDADVMAFRAGAEIAGKEFIDTHSTNAKYPYYGGFGKVAGRFLKPGKLSLLSTPGKRRNAEGVELSSRLAQSLSMEFEVHAGRGPISFETSQGINPGISQKVGGAATGMASHLTEGLWATDTTCASSLPGLYSAGDSCATMMAGACYSTGGLGTMSAAVTGARSGLGAAGYCKQVSVLKADKDEISRAKKFTLAPIERQGGFSPRWATQVLQGIMIPYFVMHIKHEDRLNTALSQVEFLENHIIPKLTANDPHELRLACETRNMVLNAEMRIRSSLFRKESRGLHYREDYPRRDDDNWLAWVVLKEEQGRITTIKRPIPDKWRPDPSMPYEEKYLARFPGE